MDPTFIMSHTRSSDRTCRGEYKEYRYMSVTCQLHVSERIATFIMSHTRSPDRTCRGEYKE